jgi:hypothetical protein
VLLGLIGRFEQDGLEIVVKLNPESIIPERNLANYPASTIKPLGSLHISNPTILQRALFPDRFLGIDLITLLCICIGSFIIILIIPKMKQKILFRDDISDLILILGFLILFHSLFSIFRLVEYIPNEIKRMTNQEFVSHNNFPIIIFAESYIALVVIAISFMFKKGVQLQEELDLIVYYQSIVLIP